jgi:DNA mismatch repair protein MutS
MKLAQVPGATGDGFWGDPPGAIAGFAGRPGRRRERWAPATFQSVLFPAEAKSSVAPQGDRYIEDLHLDEVIDRVIAGREALDLGPFFREPLGDPDAVAYRQEVFRDLEQPPMLEAIRGFNTAMAGSAELRDRAGRVEYRHERERWLLAAASAYVRAVDGLAAALAGLEVASRGLRGFATYLAACRDGAAYRQLAADIERVERELASVAYTVHIDGGRVVVARFADEPDYGAEVVEAFARFAQGDGREFRFSVASTSDMNHVEAAILARVVLLFPDAFAALDAFAEAHASYADPVVERFHREVQFYVAYLEHIGRLRAAGLAFCHPAVSATASREEVRDTFDIALAWRLVSEGQPVVVNDIELRAGERLIVVSGPNQGGKTTFSRTFGQLYHLARIGVPVPGSRARLHLADSIYTHFEREERVEDLAGKLEEDLLRIRTILGQASPNSVVVMNESFSSTTLADQLFINVRVIRALLERGCRGLAVTFLDELASLDPAIVSMTSMVDPEDSARRTFRIVRRPADGLAYAMSIAEKHGLTRARVAERLAR